MSPTVNENSEDTETPAPGSTLVDVEMRVKRYTPDTDTWKALAPLPTRRAGIGRRAGVALGAAVLGMALTYDIGSLEQMGAGFVPVVIGVLLILVGVAIGATATPRVQEVPRWSAVRSAPRWPSRRG